MADATEPQQLVGQVIAVDAEQGRLVLRTAAGMVALRGSPEVIEKLDVGDLIVVELETGEQPVRY